MYFMYGEYSNLIHNFLKLNYYSNVINSVTSKQNLAGMLIAGVVLILSLSILPADAQSTSTDINQNMPQTDNHVSEKQCERLKVYENSPQQSIRDFIKQHCGG